MSDQDRISPYNIKQTSDENKEKYQLGDYKLIQYQILQTNITRTVWQIVRRITNQILGIKGLMDRKRDQWIYTSGFRPEALSRFENCCEIAICTLLGFTQTPNNMLDKYK